MNAHHFVDRLLEADDFYDDLPAVDDGPDERTRQAWERYRGELAGLADHQVEIRMENAQERNQEDYARACWWEMELRNEQRRRIGQHDPGPPL